MTDTTLKPLLNIENSPVPVTMRPYPGWRFIQNPDGSTEHIPTYEWIAKMLDSMKAVTAFAQEMEDAKRRARDENPSDPYNQSIETAKDLLRMM